MSLSDNQGHFQGSPVVPILPNNRKHVISKIPGRPFGTEYEFWVITNVVERTHSLRGAMAVTTSISPEYVEASCLMIAFVRAMLSLLVCQSGKETR